MPTAWRERLLESHSLAVLETHSSAARWIRRIKTLAEDGIAFKRMKRGPDGELVFGINADGVLGFSLAETHGN
ncbi:MAG TPA: hypothetical protein VJ011_06835 [Steroidobacteraceae bacterium]|nr:hypothetical protein [Steroidobacteraceae bacterium]